MDPPAFEAALLAPCEGRFLSLAELSTLTGSPPESLRNHYLMRMVAEGRVALRYPESPTTQPGVTKATPAQ